MYCFLNDFNMQLVESTNVETMGTEGIRLLFVNAFLNVCSFFKVGAMFRLSLKESSVV